MNNICRWIFLTSILSIVLIFSIIIMTGCESQQAKEARLFKENVEKKEQEKEYLEMSYRYDATLLALKYKVDDEEKVFNMLVEEYDLLYSSIELEDIISGRNLKERIEKYSDKYGLQVNIIASILIDYEAMQSGYSE